MAFYTYSNGNTYDGDLLYGVKHGQGTYTWFSSGNVYEGAWVDGASTGEGTFTWAGSGNVEKGTFLNGNLNGQGTKTYAASGNVYTGAWVDGARTGEGTYTWANGDVYTGAFVDGIASGGLSAGKIPYFVGTATVDKLKTGISTTDALLYDSPKAWGSNKTYDNGTSTTITYSFVGTSDLYLFEDGYSSPNPKVDNIYSLSASQQAAVKLALEQYSNVANLTFVEVSETASEVGTLRFGFTDYPRKVTGTDDPAWGWASTPWTNAKGGDIWVGSSHKGETFERGKDYNFKSLMHEIGHALGLAHPHDGQDTLPTPQDYRNYSIMSYENPDDYYYYDSADDYNYLISSTPMVYDIAAIQHLYGAASHNTDDTVYKYDPSKPVVEAIWDSDGIDTLDFSNFGKALDINLTAGAYSTIAFTSWSMTDNLGIAFGTIIEKAIGGAGNDIITGNSSDNTLYGGAGNDVISAGDGNDIIYCGTGNDTLTGGLGSDEFIFYWGDGSNIITDFDLTLDTCTFLDTTNNKLIYTESTNSKNEVEYSLSDGTSVTLQGIYGEQTYTIPSSGLSIKHTGAGAIINAPYNLSLYDEGIFVTNTGTGSTTITATGTVKGGVGQTDQTANSDGIYAWNVATTKDLSITAKDVTGLDDGIEATNKGTGSLSISVTGDVTSTSTDTSDGDYSHGIYAYNYGTDLTVAVNGDVASNDRGLFVWNNGSGDTSITANGTVTSLNRTAIYAENVQTSTASGITINAKNANGFDEGIFVTNTGTGSTTITATGTVRGGVGQTDQTADSDGIYAWNDPTATDLSITAKNVTGLEGGIEATNKGTGSLSISVTGNVTSTSTDTSDARYSHGIYADNYGTGLTVAVNGDVTSNDRGLYLGNNGSGDTSITANGTVTAVNSGGIDVLNGDTSKDLSITAHEVSAYNNGIGAINFGTGSTTITTTGAVKGGNFQTDLAATATNGIAALNTLAATDITITVQDVTGLQGGITADNFGTGKIEINVSGNVVGLGSESEGIATSRSESTITVLTSATVSGTTEGIKTDSKADTVTVNGSVTGLNGTAILLGGGNDTVNLGATATVTGTIDGDTGSDTASFSVAKSAVDTFTYNETTKIAIVTVDSAVTTFKDFEYFKFSDDTSAMTTAEAVNALTSHTVITSVVTRDGSNITDADVVMSDGTNSSSYKSAADGSVSGVLTSGSASTVTGSLAYSNSIKAISSQDALDALKLSVGMTTAAGTKTVFDFISADFNQDGKVSSQDALAILKYSVGLTTPEQAKWVFVDTNGDYSGVSKSNTSYTEGVTIADLSADTSVSLTGILIGDVNDSYSGLIA